VKIADSNHCSSRIDQDVVWIAVAVQIGRTAQEMKLMKFWLRIVLGKKQIFCQRATTVPIFWKTGKITAMTCSTATVYRFRLEKTSFLREPSPSPYR
jgi:hypothetical protein